MLNVKPLYNNILVKPDPFDPKTKSNIIVLEQQKALLKFNTGTVIAVGQGMITPDGSIMPLTLKPGDKVIYLRGTGIEFREFVDEEPYLFFKETDIYSVVE